jgi:hypothetical protein
MSCRILCGHVYVRIILCHVESGIWEFLAGKWGARTTGSQLRALEYSYSSVKLKLQVMEDDLICNYKKCRKRLTTVAWITSCSRILWQALSWNRSYLAGPLKLSVKKVFVLTCVCTCTDVFCEEDGAREFGKQAACPACKPSIILAIRKCSIHAILTL